MRDDRFEPMPSEGAILRSAIAGMQPLLRDAPPALRRVAQAAEDTASPTDTGSASAQRNWHDTLVKIAVIGGATFLAWKLLRGLKGVFWTAFGLGMAWFWMGGHRMLF